MAGNSDIQFHEDIAIADTAFSVKGHDLNKLFENAAIALTSTMSDITKIKSKEQDSFELENSELDMLLFDFLQELLFLKDTKGRLYSKYKIQISEGNTFKLSATLSGEQIDPEKHKISIDIKAVTMHMFEVHKTQDGYEARVVVDV